MKLYSRKGYIKAVAKIEFPHSENALKKLKQMDSSITHCRYQESLSGTFFNFLYTKSDSIHWISFIGLIGKTDIERAMNLHPRSYCIVNGHIIWAA